MLMPARGGARRRSLWTAWRDSAIGWAVALGLVGAFLLVPALCLMGLIIDHAGARQGHPVLRRLGDGSGALVLAAVCFVFGIGVFAGFRRTWRLRLHGRSSRGTVLYRYSAPVERDLSSTERAVVRAGLVTVDVAVFGHRPPQVGDEIRIRYDPVNPVTAIHAHWSVFGVVSSVIVEGVVIVFGGGAIVMGLVMLYAFVEVIR
jgi:hypothetical protein